MMELSFKECVCARVQENHSKHRIQYYPQIQTSTVVLGAYTLWKKYGGTEWLLFLSEKNDLWHRF